MALQVDLLWTEVGWMVSGLVSLVCLVWLLRAAPRSALRDAFALLLAVWSLILLFPLFWVTEGGRYYLVEIPDDAFFVPEILLLVTWIAAERGARLPRWLPAAAVMGVLVVAALWVAKPTWRSLWPEDGTIRMEILFPATEAVEVAALVAIGTVFLRAALRRDSVALALAGFGFMGWPMILGILSLVELATGSWRDVWAGTRPDIALLVALPLAGACVYALGTATFLWWRGERNRARTVAVALIFGTAAITATLVALSFWSQEPAVTSAGRSGAWHGAIRILAGLSLMLAPVFGTLVVVAEANVTKEALVWRAVRRGSVPALMVATFFVVSEAAQNVFAGSLGPIVGVFATAPLVLLLTPIQRLGERFGQAVVPDARLQDAHEKEALYERQLRYAWVDGRIGATERARLVDLRKALGVTTDRAEAMEEGVVRGKAAAV